jgi:hypothetical protein
MTPDTKNTRRPGLARCVSNHSLLQICKRFFFCLLIQKSPWSILLDGDGLGKVAREVDIKAFQHSQPVCDELERDDVEDTLEDVDGLGNLNLESLAGLEFGIVRVADDDGLAATSND